MEDITPLFIYISSCDKYYQEKGIVKIKNIFIYLIMENDCQRVRFFSRSPLSVDEQYVAGIVDERVDGEHRISPLKSYNNTVCSGWGYCHRYIKPFKILFKGYFDPFLTEEELSQIDREIQERTDAFWAQNSQSDSDDNDDREIQEEVEANHSDSDDNDDEEKEELSINDFKTFKLEQCVICLEEEPKVIFVIAVIFVFVKSVSFTGTIIVRFVKRKTLF